MNPKMMTFDELFDAAEPTESLVDKLRARREMIIRTLNAYGPLKAELDRLEALLWNEVT